MACQWEDEQTGGHCADLASDFTGTRRKWFTFTNGAHIDSLDPATFNRWYDFLSLFVAHRAPATNSGLVQFAAPLFYSEAMGISNATLPPDPIQQIPTYRAALAAYEKLPAVRVLFDNGAGAGPDGAVTAGYPYAGVRAVVRRLPDPGHGCTDLVPRDWWLACHQSRPQRRRSTASPGTRRRFPPLTTHPRTPPAAGCGAMRPTGTGTGSRTRRGRLCHT